MSSDFIVIKRNVKYIRFEIKDLRLRIIVPHGFNGNVNDIIKKHEKWLNQKLALINEIKNLSHNLKIYNHKNLETLIDRYINEVGAHLYVKPAKVSFRTMKKRWGSCSPKGHIIFNKKLKFLPEELIKYVVIHEMCHLIIHNHRKKFWSLVSTLSPNFEQNEKLLSAYNLIL